MSNPAFRFLLLLLFAAPMCVSAQLNSFGSVTPELQRYLQLSPAQSVAINGLVSAWHAQVKEENARQTEIKENAAQLQSLCQEATSARAKLMRDTRAVLTDDQRKRLDALDQALHLMPRVVEAQRAGLLPDSIQSAPIGMPAGEIEVSLTFPAASPSPLPGCTPLQEVRPGTVPVLLSEPIAPPHQTKSPR